MNRLTTNQGVPIGDNQNSRTAGQNGPTLLDDYQLLEKLAHFDRERIPERVVHARGAGAHGVFRTAASMKRWTKAKFLQDEGIETPVFVRFSTVIHGQHSPETLRDPRGFSVKFYTTEGNYDFVGNNLPVFFIRDAMKFPDMVHSLKPDPRTNIQSADRYWDFMSLTPESTNMMVHVFSDEGIPANYREMRGSGVHAFKWINEHGNRVYTKLRWVPKQGVRNLSAGQAAEIQGKDFNHASRDLFEAIDRGDFPEWDLYVQILDPADLDAFDYYPLDPTKDWFEEDIPYVHIGTMQLNRNPDHVFSETEQVGFNPGVVVPGIEPSEDKLLQGRLFSYSDTQRYRIGANYLQLPINCPFAKVSNNQRDGAMQHANFSGSVNYEPSRHTESPQQDPVYIELPVPLEAGASTGRQRILKTNDFGQAGQVYRRYSPIQQDILVGNLSTDLAQVEASTQLRAICNFYRADSDLGMRLSVELGVDLTPYLQHLS
ncbi:catalase [Paenibacillus sacheonensis]|uniref:Catalase n=1 Tax=Paenibacillus sacheonensis TaxID=742054 RepID=A0A7X5C1S2_9BACL|nr:catalase [Paenibacillus sacheonensis]MBM7569158.1 catalase [Paenibacillus sacheonensis]NBC72991.1 catalase [Paenibacillus sacheonensis]